MRYDKHVVLMCFVIFGNNIASMPLVYNRDAVYQVVLNSEFSTDDFASGSSR